MDMIQTDDVTLTEFKGYPLIDYDQGDFQGKKNKSFSFGVKKAVQIAVDLPSLLTFIVAHGTIEQVQTLREQLPDMADTLIKADDWCKDDGNAEGMEAHVKEDRAANPSFPAGVDEGGNPFA